MSLTTIRTVSLLIVAYPCFVAAAPALGTENWEQIVVAAHREGKVVVSGVTGAKARELLTKGFRAEYPKIHVEYSVCHPDKLLHASCPSGA